MLDKQEENKSDNSDSDCEDNNKKIVDRKKNEIEKRQENQTIFKGIIIKDIDEKNNRKKYTKKILNKTGQFLFEIGKYCLI